VAGDWIKVEHATLDKPEVLRAAEMLGISRDAALGLLFRYWVWLDKNLSDSCPGFVRNVSRKSLDDVLHCTGFSGCLEAIGWAEFDDSAWVLRVTNADRHNGNTAKNRALDAKRKAVTRATGQNPDQRREEKRRVNTSLRSVLEAPSEEHRELARMLNVDCHAEFQKYRDHFAANGRTHKDQEAGFRNWLRKAKEFKPQARPTDKRAAVAAAIFGKRDERPIDAIDGTAERVA
jgi:hypothetical protein